MNAQKPVVRIAPSPTGKLHIGTARTALFNYLFAKHHSGKFILRIEDTDKERSKQEYEKNILESLEWLGIGYDEMFRQSERTKIYREYLEKLLAEDKIYLSKEKVEKAGDRDEVIRFRNPNKKIAFHDLIRGEVVIDTTDLHDFIVAKSLDEPLFHFTNVVDDMLMAVTHIIRGEDHISNTPRQILLYQALGAEPPLYAHIPLILNADRTKMSKRSGATALSDYRSEGYFSEAMVNFLALLGWSPQVTGGAEAEEVLSLEEIVKAFDLPAVQKGGAVFDHKKLDALNRAHIKRLTSQDFEKRLLEWWGNPTSHVQLLTSKIAPLLQDRVSNFAEAKELIESGEFDYLDKVPNYPSALLKTTKHLKVVAEMLEKISNKDWGKESLKTALWDYATEHGRGEVLWPLRVALTGREQSPDPFTIAALLGKKETLDRISHAENL